MGLFQEEDGSPFGSIYHANLLWALELLAWSPDYIARATECLLRLAELDPKGTWSNRPSRSLRQIHLLWHSQTQVGLEDRMDVLSNLRQRYPQALWELTLDLYPKSSDIAHNSPTPRWRDLVSDGPQPVTRASSQEH